MIFRPARGYVFGACWPTATGVGARGYAGNVLRRGYGHYQRQHHVFPDDERDLCLIADSASMRKARCEVAAKVSPM